MGLLKNDNSQSSCDVVVRDCLGKQGDCPVVTINGQTISNGQVLIDNTNISKSQDVTKDKYTILSKFIDNGVQKARVINKFDNSISIINLDEDNNDKCCGGDCGDSCSCKPTPTVEKQQDSDNVVNTFSRAFKEIILDLKLIKDALNIKE